MFADRQEVPVRSLLIAEHIDTRQLEKGRTLARAPLTLEVQNGSYAVLFRYGVVVLFNVAPHDESAMIREVMHYAREPLETPVVEESRLLLKMDGSDGIEEGQIVVAGTQIEKLQLIADVLAKSTVLDHYEQEELRAFERIGPMAARLKALGRSATNTRELLRHIGDVLVHQQNMVGRVEVGDKPDLLWEHPMLERFYLRLEDEFEIRERDTALERKLELISRTAQTVLDVVHAKRSLRVEWYIVFLILFEILLSLYDLFFKSG